MKKKLFNNQYNLYIYIKYLKLNHYKSYILGHSSNIRG